MEGNGASLELPPTVVEKSVIKLFLAVRFLELRRLRNGLVSFLDGSGLILADPSSMRIQVDSPQRLLG